MSCCVAISTLTPSAIEKGTSSVKSVTSLSSSFLFSSVTSSSVSTESFNTIGVSLTLSGVILTGAFSLAATSSTIAFCATVWSRFSEL